MTHTRVVHSRVPLLTRYIRRPYLHEARGDTLSRIDHAITNIDTCLVTMWVVMKRGGSRWRLLVVVHTYKCMRRVPIVQLVPDIHPLYGVFEST